MHLKNTKAGGCRIHPISLRLAELFERFIADRDAISGSFIFPADDGASHLSKRQANGRFAHWRTVAGIRKKLTMHSFRAGYATRLYRTTGDIWLVARALGHKSVTTTTRYIECDVADIRLAVERVFQ